MKKVRTPSTDHLEGEGFEAESEDDGGSPSEASDDDDDDAVPSEDEKPKVKKARTE